MDYFIFNFQNDSKLIDSFLTSAAKAHGRKTKKTIEWFLWKFRDNPFGESILSCAADNGEIIGCVAIGIQNFIHKGGKVKGGISFETFVNPDYQGGGIFKKLINKAEEESALRGLKILLNFPNNNSLNGFLRMEWHKVDIAEYWLKGKSKLKVLKNIKDLKKGFIPTPTNFNEITRVNNFSSFKQNANGSFYLGLDSDYLKWRFLSYPNSEYVIINDSNCLSIGRVGYRGKLKEVQVLFINPLVKGKFSFSSVISSFYMKTHYDIISFPISKNNIIRSPLLKKLFVKVPNKTNVCYKVLDKNFQFEPKQIVIDAINYHTY